MRGDDFFTQLSHQSAATKLHPAVAGFLKSYFAKEKAIPFCDQQVINTNFPPYPSPAFDHLIEQFARPADPAVRRLYSVTLAVTNRCPFGEREKRSCGDFSKI